MSENYTNTAVSLVSVIDEALSPLGSLVDILASGGHEDVANASSALLRDARARLLSAARCLESGCGREILLRSFGSELAPIPCRFVGKGD